MRNESEYRRSDLREIAKKYGTRVDLVRDWTSRLQDSRLALADDQAREAVGYLLEHNVPALTSSFQNEERPYDMRDLLDLYVRFGGDDETIDMVLEELSGLTYIQEETMGSGADQPAKRGYLARRLKDLLRILEATPDMEAETALDELREDRSRRIR